MSSTGARATPNGRSIDGGAILKPGISICARSGFHRAYWYGKLLSGWVTGKRLRSGASTTRSPAPLYWKGRRMGHAKVERNAAMAEQWASGRLLREIAFEFGVSLPRVRQIGRRSKLTRARRPRMVKMLRCVDCGASVQAGTVISHRKSTEHFWAMVAKGPSCWEWQGRRYPTGYGRSGHQVYSHRRSWEITNGPIPRGLHVLHKCDNPPCVRPDHLWLGTHADNMHDRDRKGRDRFGPNRPSLSRAV